MVGCDGQSGGIARLVSHGSHRHWGREGSAWVGVEPGASRTVRSWERFHEGNSIEIYNCLLSCEEAGCHFNLSTVASAQDP